MDGERERGLREERRNLTILSSLLFPHTQAKKAALTPKKKLGRPPKKATAAAAAKAGLKKGKGKPGPKPKKK